MNYDYDHELEQTYTEITSSGGQVSEDGKHVIEYFTDCSDTLTAILEEVNAKMTIDEVLEKLASNVAYQGYDEASFINAYIHSYINCYYPEKYPNLQFVYDSTTNSFRVTHEVEISEYCKEKSIYYPTPKDTSNLSDNKLSFNVANLESIFNDWKKKYGIKLLDNGYLVGNDDYGDGCDPSVYIDNPLFMTFYRYCIEMNCDDFDLEDFVTHIKETGFTFHDPITAPVTFKNFSIDPSTGLITFDTSNLESYDYRMYNNLRYVANSSYLGKVSTDLQNHNEIQYRVSISFLLDYYNTMYEDIEFDEASLIQFLKGNGLEIQYQDGDYLYFNTMDEQANQYTDHQFLANLLYVENCSDSLYDFDAEELVKKANCFLGISGMELDQIYYNLGSFPHGSLTEDEKNMYNELIKKYGSDIGKIYSSTYNNFTVFLPREPGSDTFNDYPRALYDLVNSNDQSIENLGYTISVRIDSMKEFEPDGFNCEDYKNIVAVRDDQGKITGYKIILSNNQYQLVEPNDNNAYTLYGDPQSVDSVVRESVAYECLQISQSLSNSHDVSDKLDFVDVKYSDGKYYFTVNGEQIVLDKDEVIDENNEIRSDIMSTLVNNSSNTRVNDDGTRSINRVTVTNRRIVNKPKCISFDDETNYRGLVQYLKEAFITLMSETKIEKNIKDDKDVYEKLSLDGVKETFELAMQEANESGVKIETSVRVLKTYDQDLKGIFDLMINDIFKLGSVGDNEMIRFDTNNADPDEYKSRILGDTFEGNIDDYVVSLQNYCKRQYDLLDSKYKLAKEGLEMTPDELELLNDELGLDLSLNSVVSDIGPTLVLSNDSLEILASQLLAIEGDGFNMSSWLSKKAAEYARDNPNSSSNPYQSIENKWDYYNGMINNTDNVANELAMYDRIQKAAPLVKYAVTEEYDEALDYIRNNYDDVISGIRKASGYEDETAWDYMSLEEITLFLMDANNNEEADYYTAGRGNVMDLLTTLKNGGIPDNTISEQSGYILNMIADKPYVSEFFKTYGFEKFGDREARTRAVQDALAAIEDGRLSYSEQGFQPGFLDGLTKYGKNTVDYITCGCFGEDSFWDSADTRDAYLLELYAGNYTRSQVEEMYRKGLITEDDYNVRIAVLNDENHIREDYQNIKKVSGFIESLGSTAADVLIQSIPGFGKSLLEILKTTSTAGKVARKLHDAGESHGETFTVSLLNGLGTYFFKKAVKEVSSAMGNNIFAGDLNNYSEEDIRLLKDAFDAFAKNDEKQLLTILNNIGINKKAAQRLLRTYDYFNSTFNDQASDIASRFFSLKSVDSILTNGLTTLAYTMWQNAEGDPATLYNYDKFMSNDLFEMVDFENEHWFGDLTSDVAKARAKDACKNMMKWLIGIVTPSGSS